MALLRMGAATVMQDPRVEEYARQALEMLPPGETAGRAMATMLLGTYLFLKGRYVEAEPLLVESCDVLQGTNYVLLGMDNLALINAARGNLHRAEELAKRAISLGEGHPNTGPAHLWLGMVYLWWNDLGASAVELEKAAALDPTPANVGLAYLWLSDVRSMQGDVAAAARALERAERVLLTGNPPAMNRARVAAQHVNLALYQEDAESVSRWLDEITVCAGISTITPAVMHLLLKRRGEAVLEQLKADYESSRKEDLCYGPIFVRVAQAVASSDPDDAMSFMAEALDRARRGGFIRPLITWGTHLAPLLRQAISRGFEAEYARKLLNIIESEDLRLRASKSKTAPGRLSTALLSERELEVVQLLAEGLSNQEIADRLKVSLATARTHVYHAFDKLNAKDRLQAVMRAKELRLL